MKHLPLLRHALLTLAMLSCLPLLGCGGCASLESNAAKKQGPVQWDLSPNAQVTYAFLLYDQAMRLEDESLLLRAMEELKAHKPPLALYVEGSLWLLSRRSPMTDTFIAAGLEAFPEDLTLNMLYAEALMGSGRTAEAIAYTRAFSSAHPQYENARLDLALLLVKDQQYPEALHIFASFTGKQRTSLVDYYHARALIGMDRSADAVPYLQKAIKKAPDFIEAMAELAYIHEKSKNYAAARKIYEKMLKLNDSSQEVLLRLVSLSLRENQPDKALEFARRGPATPDFGLTVASMFLEARQYSQAEILLNALVKDPAAPPEIYYYLSAVAYEGRQDVAAALRWLDKIPVKNTYFDRATVLRVQLLIGLGQLPEALAAAQAGQISSPEQVDLWKAEIRLLVNVKNAQEALDAAHKALVRWPEDSEVAFLRASLLDDTGRKKEALQAMEELITRHPDHYQGLNYVGYTLAEHTQDLPRAVELLQKAVRLAPDSSYILDSLAWAQFKAGQSAQAWENIVKATKMKGEPDPTIWEHYGDIAKALGHVEESRKGYRKALEFKPANADSLRKKLEK